MSYGMPYLIIKVHDNNTAIPCWVTAVVVNKKYTHNGLIIILDNIVQSHYCTYYIYFGQFPKIRVPIAQNIMLLRIK